MKNSFADNLKNMFRKTTPFSLEKGAANPSRASLLTFRIRRLVLLLATAIGILGTSVAQVSIPYATSGTFVPPTGITQVTVECWGGGGHGSTRTTDGTGGGGGGGAYARSVLTVVPGTSYTVTVGAGSTSATAGGDSWFNSAAIIMAKGGSSVANNTATGAAGGLASASVGTVKFNGGTGATGATNSGGGGSSAGTAAAGANGAVIAGGTAPAGGGDGGDGVTGNSNGNGGSFPGGGGGGAKRSSGTRNGGDGGGGYVIVSYTYPLGTCMNAVTANAITDDGCGTAPFVLTIPISGQPTTLGTGAGNAYLLNISLIISHTWNNDLDITLTSPVGTTRNIILDRFGNGDNLGNPASCPGSALVIQDGGTALNNTNTSNVTGTYAPEQTLAGFTGNPNGNWILTICDDNGVDVGNLRYFNMSFCTVPTSAAGSDQAICTGSSATLAANSPSVGTGAWTVVSGPSTSTSQFSSTAANNAVFTPAGGTGTYTLRWTVTNSPCPTATDDVVITVNGNPTTATVGGAQTICASGTTTALGGNTPSVGTGAWSVVSGGTGTFSNSASGSSTFTHTGGAGPVVVRWTISNSPCTASTADVSITIIQPPTTATVGGAQTICALGTTTGLGGNTPSNGTGAWSIVSGGTGSFNPNNTTPNATFTHATGTGPVVVRWTITGTSPCPASFANLSITISQNPTTATVGGAQTICASGTTAALGGNTPSVGTGAWSVVSGGAGTFSNAASGSSTFTHTSGTGPVVLRWTISNNPCTASSANVSITITPTPTTADAGTDQTICYNATATLAANNPTNGTGAWSVVSGPSTSTSQFSSTAANNATFTPAGGAGTYTLRWTISNSPCTASTNDVVITVNPFANAVSQTFNSNGTFTVPAGVTQITVEAWGGGGSGGGANDAGTLTARGGAGGGGGAYALKLLTVTPGSVLNISVGAAVSGTSAGAGTNGNPTTITGFTGQIYAAGGSGGAANITGNTPTGGAGGTVAASQGDTKIAGVNGGNGATGLGISSGAGGAGGNGGGAGGAAIGSGTANGNAGTAPGGGGSGSRTSQNTGNTTGGSGAAGRMIITYTPVANLTATATSICQGTSVTLTASGGGTYSWSPGGATSASINVSPSSTTNYSVTITNTCSATLNQSITVAATPTSANAGSTQNICVSPGSTTMAANTPLAGTGAWSQVSGPVTATIANTALPNTGISGMTTAGTYVFRWTISNPPCTASQSNVTVNVAAQPTTAAAGPDQSVCASVGTITMAANTALVGTGSWSQVSGPASASIVSSSSPGTIVNGLTTPGSFVFRWTISNGACTASTSDMTVTVKAVPTTANAGPAQIVCANPGSATMAANNPSAGTGAWTQLSGPLTATITTPSAYNTTITGMTTAGSYVFRWTISNSPCISSQNSVTITVNPEPTVANAGPDQNVCVSPGTTTMAANTAAVGTGSWSQVSGPLAASFADASDPLTGVSGLSAAGTYVFRWSITSTSCTPSEDDVDVVVSGSPTTAAAGPDQIICSTIGDATMAANTSSVGAGAWTQTAGPVTATITTASSPSTTITGMTTAGTYSFRWTITNSPCSPSQDDVDIISGGCAYYSQATGDVTDPIWSTMPVGTPGFATFLPVVSMIIQNGHVVTNTSTTAVDNLTVDAGGDLTLNSGTSMQVNGTNATFNGTLTASDNSELELAGNSPTTLALASTTSFYVLTVNTPAGTTLTGTAHIRGTLNLQDGNFNCTGNQVVLRSTATYTGRLGPVAASASYTGNMRIERYVPAGATNWRLLGSPIMNRKVNHLMDDFTTAGFPGSHVPYFDQPVGSGNLWPSIRWYDETNTGGGQNDGMTGVSSNNQPLTTGQGFAAWSGSGLYTTTAFTIDLENQVPVIASSPISLPMSYTNTGNAAVDGWNLVSNPLPSPIAFDQIARGADVADYITYFNPATGNTATYDISSGISVNGGTNTIQSMQGFFLKAGGPAATATVDESAKVAGNGGGFFGGMVEDGPAVLHLGVTSAINSFSDETIVVFSEGSPAVDGDDVPKYVFGHPDAPQIATMGPAGQLIAINAYGAYSTDISIPVMVDAGVTGTYTLTVIGAQNMGLSCLRIEDMLTGDITMLSDSSTYSFDMDAAADASTPRLMLHATAPLPFVVTDANCHGDENGAASVEIIGGNSDVIWMNDMGAVIDQQNGASGIVEVQDLAAGDYQVSVASVHGCADLSHLFSVQQPEELDVNGTTADASCPNTADGSVSLNVSGGTAPYTFLWSNASTASPLVAGAGDYDVVVSDAHDCVVNSNTFTIASGPGPLADANADVTTVMVNTPVTFVNNSTPGAQYAWDFGDGNSSNDAAPQHSYSTPGVYTVVLTVTEGPCTATITIEITVEVNTGIEEANTVSMSAWISGDQLVVEHGFADKYPVQLDVLNEAGQVFIQHKVAGPAGRFTIPAEQLSSGIWYVRVSNDQVRKTIPVVVVR